MRLGIRLLNSNASLNQFHQVSNVKIAQGESPDIFFQLVDLDQNGLRYIPASGATVEVIIPRDNDILRLSDATRQNVNLTITRQAAPAFSEDRSIWTIPLLSSETSQMVSTAFRVEVTEGSTKKIAMISQAIQIIS